MKKDKSLNVDNNCVNNSTNQLNILYKVFHNNNNIERTPYNKNVTISHIYQAIFQTETKTLRKTSITFSPKLTIRLLNVVIQLINSSHISVLTYEIK